MDQKAKQTRLLWALLSSLVVVSPVYGEERLEEEILVEGTVVAIGQRTLGGSQNGKDESKMNFRADLGISAPAGELGEAEGKFFAHIRMGQGNGLGMLNPTLTSTVNSSTFARADGGLTMRLAQAWYELSVPLEGWSKQARSRLKLTMGKIDLFAFFDQNDIADDESSAFLNNVFVHNPLLDSGGDLEADGYGFAPGMRIAYGNEYKNGSYWQASLGFLSKNEHLNPFVIGQVEVGDEYLSGKNGVYRMYVWSGGYATPYANGSDSSIERHTGWGISMNQQVAAHLDLFARYGHSIKGKVKFDQGVTLGAEVGGAYWDREHDRLGMAVGWLDTSKGFRADAPVQDANGDLIPDFGFAPGGAEKQYEIYYAWKINKYFELSPDFQWIAKPSGDSSARNISVFGLRARLGF